MSPKLYSRIHSEVSRNWQETSLDCCIALAAAEERDAALKDGRVNKNGTTMIEVIADGCWGKRSYRTNYS